MTRTNAYSLLCMIIRAVAVWSLAKMAISLPGAVMAIRNSPQGAGFGGAWFLGAMVVGVLIVAGLWLFADKLAKLALTRPQDLQFVSSLESSTWFGLALSAIGAWFLFGGLVDAAYWLTHWVIAVRSVDEGLASDTAADMVATAVQIALGAGLVLRGQGLSRWIHRLRYGVEPSVADPGS